MKSMIVEDVSDYLAFWTSKLVCHMVPLCNANNILNILNRKWESLFQNMSKMLLTLFLKKIHISSLIKLQDSLVSIQLNAWECIHTCILSTVDSYLYVRN